MIDLDRIEEEAWKKEEENYEFRRFLKRHVNAEELDKKFLKLHEELFAEYDCSKCRNCCKMYKGSIPQEDIEKDAEYLGLKPAQLIRLFLEKQEYENVYYTKNKPCDFLLPDGNCKLGECKPEGCKKYPYTDQPDRLGHLLGMLGDVEVCPILFEMFERLKAEYNFKIK